MGKVRGEYRTYMFKGGKVPRQTKFNQNNKSDTVVRLNKNPVRRSDIDRYVAEEITFDSNLDEGSNIDEENTQSNERLDEDWETADYWRGERYFTRKSHTIRVTVNANIQYSFFY